MKRIILFLLMSGLVLADSTIDFEAAAKAIVQDPSFDKSKVIGTWAAGADAKATLILESDGTFRMIKEKEKEKEPITGTWIGGKGQQIVLRFKSSDSDHFIALNLVGGELVDDQVCYKIVYSRK